MTLTMASANNISFSEAQKSMRSQSYNSSPPQFSDPRFDYENFPNLPSPRLNPSPPSFESYNRFSLLRDYGYSPPYLSSSDSFASAANKRKISPSDGNPNNRKLPPRNSTPQATNINDNNLSQGTSDSPPRQQHHPPTPPIFREHYEQLAFPNGRPSFSHGNGVALPTHSSHIPPLMSLTPSLTPFPDQSNLFRELFGMINNISSFLSHISNSNFSYPAINTRDIAPPFSYSSRPPPPYPSSHFPPLNSEIYSIPQRFDSASSQL